MEDRKHSNPKSNQARTKFSMSCLPVAVLAELSTGAYEGAIKYGKHNYRETEISGAEYWDATLRHLMYWWEGEDLDPLSKVNHITKAISSLMVLRDSMISGTFVDDRPPRCKLMVAALDLASESTFRVFNDMHDKNMLAEENSHVTRVTRVGYGIKKEKENKKE